MSKVRVLSFAISIDGYGAGPNQDLQNPLGVGGPELMEWFFHTHVWRNMFGPVRGPWPDESWKGWWGEEPPYRTPVFVLTHHARARHIFLRKRGAK
jgi:dihydrofolate reductase